MFVSINGPQEVQLSTRLRPFQISSGLRRNGIFVYTQSCAYDLCANPGCCRKRVVDRRICSVHLYPTRFVRGKERIECSTLVSGGCIDRTSSKETACRRLRLPFRRHGTCVCSTLHRRIASPSSLTEMFVSHSLSWHTSTMYPLPMPSCVADARLIQKLTWSSMQTLRNVRGSFRAMTRGVF